MNKADALSGYPPPEKTPPVTDTASLATGTAAVPPVSALAADAICYEHAALTVREWIPGFPFTTMLTLPPVICQRHAPGK